MTTPDFVTFYMEPELCQSAQAGKHNCIGKIANVLSRAGLEVQYVLVGSEGRSDETEWSLTPTKKH